MMAISCRRLPGPFPDGAERSRSTDVPSNGTWVQSSVVHTLLSHSVGELVGRDHEAGADDALDQARCRGHTPLPADDALEVDVGVEHFARCRADRVTLEQDLLEANRQDPEEAQ